MVFIAIFIVIFVILVFFGVMGHISKATDVGCGYVTFYVIVWIVSFFMLCDSWGSLNGFFSTLWAIIVHFLAPFLIHLGFLLLKEFVVWALKGLEN